MKMFLTRLGVNSKMVITGDKTQVDLPPARGFRAAPDRAHPPGHRRHRFHYFTETDVVRHRLVRDIVKAYARGPVTE